MYTVHAPRMFSLRILIPPSLVIMGDDHHWSFPFGCTMKAPRKAETLRANFSVKAYRLSYAACLDGDHSEQFDLRMHRLRGRHPIRPEDDVLSVGTIDGATGTWKSSRHNI